MACRNWSRMNCDLRRAEGFGAIQKPAVHYKKINRGRCQGEILGAEILRAEILGTEIFRGTFRGCRVLMRPALGEAYMFERMHLLQLILAGVVEDDSAGGALHRLCAGAFEFHMPGQGCGAQLILFAGEQKLGFVGVNLRIRSWLFRSAAHRRSFC